MFYVYLLRLKNGQIYTGFTENLRNRLKEHKLGKVSSTSKRLPIDLIHYEAYLRESDARRRERYLKTSQGKNFLKQQIRDLISEFK